MTISALAFDSPPPPSKCGDHPELLFYATYSKDVTLGSLENIQFDKYYAAHCKFFTVHGELIQGERQIRTYLLNLYGAFPKVTRDFKSMTVVSDTEAETHTIHIELITTPWLDREGRVKVDIPQAFAYVLSRADEDKGQNGLQFTELRNYYDMSLLENAKAALGAS